MTSLRIAAIVALACTVGALIPQPLTNGFEPDDAVIIHVGLPSNPTRLPLPFPGQLQPVFVAHHSKRYRRTEPTFYLFEGCGLPLDNGPKGYGQAVLSGDGNFATLACYPYSNGTSWQQSTEAVVGIISADGTAKATSVAFTVSPGESLYTAVTDNGTGIWVGSSTGLWYLGGDPVGSTSSGIPLYARQPIISGKPITGLSITVNPDFTGEGVRETDGVLPKIAPAVRGFPSFLLASSPVDGDVLALSLEGAASPSVFDALPRSSADISIATFLFNDGWPRNDVNAPPRPLYGNSIITFPRGPDLLSMGNATSTGPYPVPYPYFVLADTSGGSYGLLMYHARGGLARKVIIDSQSDVYTASGVSVRSPGTVINMISTMFRQVDVNLEYSPLFFVHCNSATEAYRYLYTVPEEDGAPDRALSTLLFIPKHHRGRRRLTGITIVPYAVSLPPPPQSGSRNASAPDAPGAIAPTAAPTVTATQTATLTLTPATTASPTPVVSGVTPTTSPAAPSIGPKGVFVGPPLSKKENKFNTELLLLRIGSKNFTHPGTATARPLFLDSYRRLPNLTFEKTVSLPIPSTAIGSGMRACTGSLQSSRLRVRVDQSSNTADLGSAVFSCYDVEANGVNNITILRPTVEQAENGLPYEFQLRQPPLPPAVAGMVSADGFVDTRNIVSAIPECRYSEVMGIAKAAPFAPAFYVGTRPLAGAPDGTQGVCGVRYVPVGNYQGGLDVSLAGAREDALTSTQDLNSPVNAAAVARGILGDGIFFKLPVEGSGLSIIFNRMFIWDYAQEDLACMGCHVEGTAPRPGGQVHSGVLPLKRSVFKRVGPLVELVGFFILITDYLSRPDGVFDAYLRNVLSADRSQPARLGILMSDNAPGNWTARPKVKPLPGPMDEKPILDVVLTDQETESDIEYNAPGLEGQRIVVMRAFYRTLYLLTGQIEDSTNAKRGNSLWSYRFPNPSQKDSSLGNWTKLQEFECCDEFVVSIDINSMTAELAPSATPTVTASGTATPTPTPTSTPPPFFAELRAIPQQPIIAQQASSAVPSQRAAKLSQALPPVSLQLFARGCQSRDGRALLNCSTADQSVGPSKLGLVVQTVAEVECPPGADGVLRPVVTQEGELTVYPWTGGSATDASSFDIRCTLTAKQPAFGSPGFAGASTSTSLRFDHLPYRWPVWSDLVLFYPAADTLYSSRYGVAWKGVFGSPAKAATAAEDSSAFAAVVTEFLALFVAPKAFAPASSSREETFAATLTQAAQATLIAEGAVAEAVALFRGDAVSSEPRVPGFTPATRVSLNGVQLSTLWVSPLQKQATPAVKLGSPGTLLHFALPSIACADAVYVKKFGPCGYATLTVSQPSLPLSVLGAAPSSSSSASSYPPFFDLACPPACPGLYAGETSPLVGYSPVFPAPTSRAAPLSAPWPLYLAGAEWGSRLSRHPAFLAVLPQEPAPLRNPVTGGSTTAGINIAQACPGYTDPSFENACTNTSHPLFTNCAFGDGVAEPCRPCPPNAVCPGGRRARPVPKYWTEGESSGAIVACAPPSDQRCLGWADELGSVRCGSSYQQGSYACLECRLGTYPDDKSETGCSPCKSGSPYVQILVRFLVVIGIVLGISIGVYLLLLALAKSLGSTLEKSAGRFLDLVLFFVLLMQMLSEVSSTATAGLPPSIQGLYSFLSAFNLEVVAIHRNCLVGVPPFLSEILSLVAVMLINAAFLFFAWTEGRKANLLSELRSELAETLVRLRNGKQSQLSSSSAVMTVSTPAATESSKPEVTPAGSWALCRCACLSCREGSTRSKSCAAIRTWCVQAVTPARMSFIARVLCIALVALYARTSIAVFNGINCFQASLSIPQYANLDGVTDEMVSQALASIQQADPSALAKGSAMVTVELLRLNPNFLCNQGSHKTVAALSWLVLFLYIIGFPFATFLLSLSARAAERKAETSKGPSSPAFSALEYPVLSFLLHNTYRSACYFFRQIEMALLLLLSLIAVFWKQASGVSGFAWRGAVTCGLAISTVALLVRLKPYTQEEGWRLPLRALSSLLACLITIINSLHGSSQLADVVGTERGIALTQAVSGLGVFLLVMVLLYLLTLSYYIGKSMIVGAKAEARALELKRKLELQMQMARRAVSRNRLAGDSTRQGLDRGDDDEDDGGVVDYVHGKGKAGRSKSHSQDLELVDDKGGRRYVTAQDNGPTNARRPGGAFALASDRLQSGHDKGNSSLASRAILAGFQPLSGSSAGDAGLHGEGRFQAVDVGFNEESFEGGGPEFQTRNPIGFAAANVLSPGSRSSFVAPGGGAGGGLSGVRRGSALSKFASAPTTSTT